MPRRGAPLVLRSVEVRPRAAPVAPDARRAAALRRLAIIVATASLSVLSLAPPAAAQPVDPPADDPIVFEGGTRALRDQLDETQSAWLDAKVALDASVARQQELEATLIDVREQIEVQTADLGRVAYVAFITAGHTGLSSLVNSGPLDELLDGMGLLDMLATRETTLIQALIATRARAHAAQVDIDRETATQDELLVEMDTRKQQAQLAVCRAAGGCAAEDEGTFTAASSHVAQAAPRNANGSWPAEYIPRDRPGYPFVIERAVTGHPYRPDPITPRLAHMIRQAKAAGFTRYVTCFRHEENGGEHPRGRACDFGLGGGPTGGNSVRGSGKSYGDQLAAFLIFNAERLGVLYIVWYRQIWLVSTGRWRYYSGCCDPSSMHTDHVHVSIR
jgi:hypothetical protein